MKPSTLEIIRDLKVNESVSIEYTDLKSRQVFNAIYNLQNGLGQEYLVDGLNGKILVNRIK